MCQCDFPKRGPRIGAGPGLSVILLIGLLLLITVSETSAQYQLRKPTGQAATASITITAPADGTTWETGEKYDITWNSSGLKGSVKIDLIAGNGKASPVARQTLNNGKYSFTVSRSIAEGDYKIRVSSADGKTVGESAGTIHVGKASGPAKKTAIAGGYQPTAGGQPTGGQQAGASGPTQATGTAGTVGGIPSGSATPTGAAASAGTATRDPAQLHDQASASGTITQVGNLTPIQVPESDLQRREIVGTSVGLSGMTQVQASQNIRPNPTTITVVQPAADDFWVAGSPQTIRWNSSNLDGPVKIDLVHAVSAQQYDFYPVAASTNNTGSFNYMAPANLNTGPHNFYLQVATPDDQVKAFSPPFDVYHEAVDMTCKVVGLKRKKDTDYYVVYAETDEWLQFDVWFRNNGTLPQVTVPTIRVMLIKEPEELVVAQEEFGFSGITPRLWYKTPEPRKFNIRHSAAYQGTNVNLRNGAYRVEVEVDPLNNLGEDPNLRQDNKTVKRFTIR